MPITFDTGPLLAAYSGACLTLLEDISSISKTIDLEASSPEAAIARTMHSVVRSLFECERQLLDASSAASAAFALQP
jgi:hypothetical protein